MDMKKLNAAIKKKEKEVAKLEEQIATEKAALKTINKELKMLLDLMKKKEDFETMFTSSLANILNDTPETTSSETTQKDSPTPSPKIEYLD